MHYCLGDYVLDMAQNAVEAGSGEVIVEIEESEDGVSVIVRDDGRGMTAEERARALDPFYSDGTKHAKRRVGLGLPFLAQAVDQAGGKWAIESAQGAGTEVSFSFPRRAWTVPRRATSPPSSSGCSACPGITRCLCGARVRGAPTSSSGARYPRR